MLPLLSWGGRTYQVNEPRFTDNGLLFEPSTTNLAASVIDVTNASTKGWVNQNSTGTFEVSSTYTYSHEHSFHFKEGNNRVYFKFSDSYPAGWQYSFSCKVFVVKGVARIHMEIGPLWENNGFFQSKTIGKWETLSLAFKPTKEGYPYFFFYCDPASEYYIDDIQVEFKQYATSFTPDVRGAADRLTVSEWVVNRPAWTCEFDCALNDRQVNYERPVLFGMASWDGKDGGKMFRYETSTGYSTLKGPILAEMSVLDQTLTSPHRNAVTFDNGKVSYYHDGKLIGTMTETSGDKVLSTILMGDCLSDPFNGCIKNFHFSSTVHTPEKIVTDSKLDALPVEDDTVLYMPLKQDLSMYGKAVK